MKKLLIGLVPGAVLLSWLLLRGSTPPEVRYVSVTRGTLVSTLTTNGKVEPAEWTSVHAEVAGAVEAVPVQRGQVVRRAQVLATISGAEAQAGLSSARSRVSQARAELEVLEAGGRAGELAEIRSGLSKAESELETARHEVKALEKLVARNAATQADLTAARQAVQAAELQIDSFRQRRASLVTQPDRQAAKARLDEAESSLTAANRRLNQSRVRSPMEGVVYALDVKPGEYVQPGSEIARVGRLQQLRVILYVDEPELGRVEKGMPVTITWDAMPGREWKGKVESLPLQVVAMGTRQVGEVICIIDNSDADLIPGTNINAEIRSRVVDDALIVPKEVLRREEAGTGVYKIESDRAIWQAVKLGASSVTHIEIVDGLEEGDLVALPLEAELHSGDRVRPAGRG